MKIDQNVSSIYRLPERNQAGQSPMPLPALDGDGEKRRPVPSVYSGSSSNSLASALWSVEANRQEQSGVVEETSVGTSAADEFMKWSKMSLAEKIRAQILEAKGLTEESLAAMDEDARAAIEAEIKEAIKRQLGMPEGQEGAAAAL